MPGIKILRKEDYEKLLQRVENAEMRAKVAKNTMKNHAERNHKLLGEIDKLQQSLEEAHCLCEMYDEALREQIKAKMEVESEFHNYIAAEIMMRG